MTSRTLRKQICEMRVVLTNFAVFCYSSSRKLVSLSLPFLLHFWRVQWGNSLEKEEYNSSLGNRQKQERWSSPRPLLQLGVQPEEVSGWTGQVNCWTAWGLTDQRIFCYPGAMNLSQTSPEGQDGQDYISEENNFLITSSEPHFSKTMAPHRNKSTLN